MRPRVTVLCYISVASRGFGQQNLVGWSLSCVSCVDEVAPESCLSSLLAQGNSGTRQCTTIWTQPAKLIRLQHLRVTPNSPDLQHLPLSSYQPPPTAKFS